MGESTWGYEEFTAEKPEGLLDDPLDGTQMWSIVAGITREEADRSLEALAPEGRARFLRSLDVFFAVAFDFEGDAEFIDTRLRECGYDFQFSDIERWARKFRMWRRRELALPGRQIQWLT